MLNGSVYECNLLSASPHIHSAYSEIRKDSEQSTHAKCLTKVNTQNFGIFFYKNWIKVKSIGKGSFSADHRTSFVGSVSSAYYLSGLWAYLDSLESSLWPLGPNCRQRSGLQMCWHHTHIVLGRGTSLWTYDKLCCNSTPLNVTTWSRPFADPRDNSAGTPRSIYSLSQSDRLSKDGN